MLILDSSLAPRHADTLRGLGHEFNNPVSLPDLPPLTSITAAAACISASHARRHGSVKDGGSCDSPGDCDGSSDRDDDGR
jgi:hypothetical protein